jgi:hypothetical protein
MKLRSAIAALLCIVLVGCPSQATLAALTAILGSSAASIASIEGNPTLAAKLQTDTAAAVTAVQNWKSGTPATEAIEALNLVETDLNLFPNLGVYGPLIDLAIGTVESILALLPASSSPVAPQARHRAVSLAQPAPRTSGGYKRQWNAIVNANPSISKSVLIK